MHFKVFIFVYIFIFIGFQSAPFAGSEGKMGFMEPNEWLKAPNHNKNIAPGSNLVDLEKIIASDSNSIVKEIEESDIFEPEESYPEIKSSNAKKWGIKIQLGPFKSKDDAQKALNSIKIDSSDKLFGTDMLSPILNLSDKFFSFKIIEVKPSVELNKKTSQANLKTRSLKDIDEKIINRTHEKGVDWEEINRKYIRDFHEDMGKLNIASPTEEPKVIDHIYEKPATPADSKYMVEVTTAGTPLRVRESPLITSPIIYRVKNGTRFLSVEEPKLDETENWVRIEYLKGEFGWISKTYSKTTDFLDSKLVDHKNIEPKSQVGIGEFNVAQVYNWIKAWENKNIDLYLSFYSENFKGYKENRSTWEASRRHALKNRLSMTIEAKNIEIARNDKKVKVSFIQIFQSDDYKDIGKKEIEWEMLSNGWKIVRENWSSL